MLDLQLIQGILYIGLLLIGGAQAPADAVRPQPPASSISISPEKIDFGSQPVGVTSPPKSATVTNVTDAPIRILDVTASGIDFAETDKCGGSLAPGAHCEIDVTFTPAIAGPRIGTIIITGPDPASPRFLVVTGVGQ